MQASIQALLMPNNPVTPIGHLCRTRTCWTAATLWEHQRARLKVAGWAAQGLALCFKTCGKPTWRILVAWACRETVVPHDLIADWNKWPPGPCLLSKTMEEQPSWGISVSQGKSKPPTWDVSDELR